MESQNARGETTLAVDIVVNFWWAYQLDATF